jgi:hypothetical protein
VLTNEYNIELNIRNTVPLRTNITLVQNDKDTNIFNFTILNKKTPVNLTDVNYITITFLRPDNIPVISDGIIIEDATIGKLQYALNTTEISIPGQVITTIEFYGENNERLTSSQFIFNVREELANNEAIESTDDYNVLSKLLIAGQNETARMGRETERINAENERNNAENIRIANEEIRIENENNREGRLNAIEQAIDTINNTTIPNIKYYKWIEQKTVPLGSNTITLANTYTVDQELLIFDVNYGCKWEQGIHWNISGQTITFTETSFTQEMIFKIYNLG